MWTLIRRKLPRYKPRASKNPTGEVIPSSIARHKAIPYHQEQEGEFSQEYIFIPSLIPYTFSKLLLTNGMMLEIVVSCGLIRHGHSYSSNQDGYSINKCLVTCKRRKGTKHSRPRSESPCELYSRLLTVFSVFTRFTFADFVMLVIQGKTPIVNVWKKIP